MYKIFSRCNKRRYSYQWLELEGVWFALVRDKLLYCLYIYIYIYGFSGEGEGRVIKFK